MILISKNKTSNKKSLQHKMLSTLIFSLSVTLCCISMSAIASMNPIANIVAQGKGTAINYDGQRFYWISDSSQPVLINKQGYVEKHIQSDELVNSLKTIPTSNNKIIAIYSNQIKVFDKNLTVQKTIKLPSVAKIRQPPKEVVENEGKIVLTSKHGFVLVDIQDGKVSNILLDKPIVPALTYYQDNSIITIEHTVSMMNIMSGDIYNNQQVISKAVRYNLDGDKLQTHTIKQPLCYNNITKVRSGLAMLCQEQNNALTAIVLGNTINTLPIRQFINSKGNQVNKFIFADSNYLHLSKQVPLPSGQVVKLQETSSGIKLIKTANYNFSALAVSNFISLPNANIIQDKHKGLMISNNQATHTIPYYLTIPNFISQNGENVKITYGNRLLNYDGIQFSQYDNLPTKKPVATMSIPSVSPAENKFKKFNNIDPNHVTEEYLSDIFDIMIEGLSTRNQANSQMDFLSASADILKYGVPSVRVNIPVASQTNMISTGYDEALSNSDDAFDFNVLNLFAQQSMGEVFIKTANDTIKVKDLATPLMYSISGQRIPTYSNIAKNGKNLCFLFSFNQVGCADVANKSFQYLSGNYDYVFEMNNKIYAITSDRQLVAIDNNHVSEIANLQHQITNIKKTAVGYLLLTKDKTFYHFNGSSARTLRLPKPANDVFLDTQGWIAVDNHSIFTSNGSRKTVKGGIFITKSAKSILLFTKSGEATFFDHHLNEQIKSYMTPNGVISITPEGYFDGSYEALKGLNIIHKNKVYSLDYFYDLFYRPDIIKAKLQGDNSTYESKISIEEVLNQPAPRDITINIPNSAKNSKNTTIDFSITSDIGGIGDVMVYHNGKLIKSDTSYASNGSHAPIQGLALSLESNSSKYDTSKSSSDSLNAIHRTILRKLPKNNQLANILKPARTDRIYKKGDVYSGKVTIPIILGQKNEISVVAYNQNNTMLGQTKTENFVNTLAKKQPKLYILAVGINEFKGFGNLSNATNDAQQFIQSYIKSMHTLKDMETTTPIVLLDSQATRANILAKLSEISKQAEPQDTIVWFVASHGLLDNNSAFNIVTHDTQCQDNSEECKGLSQVISSNDILSISKLLPTLNQIFIFDTCHAGGVNGRISGLYDARMSVLAKNMGFHLMAGAADTQTASDGINGNGLFTYSILKGLNNYAKDVDSDGYISIIELGSYVKDATEKEANAMGFRQSPFIKNFGANVNVYKK